MQKKRFQLALYYRHKKTAADISALNCQANFLKYGSKNLCSNVISDHARSYFVTHCALIELLCKFSFLLRVRAYAFCICMFYQCVGE